MKYAVLCTLMQKAITSYTDMYVISGNSFLILSSNWLISLENYNRFTNIKMYEFPLCTKNGRRPIHEKRNSVED